MIRRRSRAWPGGSLTTTRPLDGSSPQAAPETAEARLRSQGGGQRGNQGFTRYKYMNHFELQPQSLCLRPHFAHDQ
jgi:hypothetical protein